ncbi:head GIN domain-containing protein [Spongiimicrobium salis]|uniref:head GIN domain-containing protein n=1 Tax=Spongiimicrobium salis TaxID=1667022 RepID=UPI00374CAE01
MKHILGLLWILMLLSSCNGDNVPDCFQNAGDMIREEITLPNFTRITVFEKVQLVLREGPVQRVEIETGEFLRNEVSAEVEGDRLLLRNENGCNFTRDFGLTTIFVTAPNITEIRSSTGLEIRSDGVLTYPALNLLSEGFLDPDAQTTDGSFNLEVASENIAITSNGIAFFDIRGRATNFSITISAGDSRVEARELNAENVILNHRGTNTILVSPQESISGVIRGLGDVEAFNRPPEVNVEELFRGRLIFK